MNMCVHIPKSPTNRGFSLTCSQYHSRLKPHGVEEVDCILDALFSQYLPDSFHQGLVFTVLFIHIWLHLHTYGTS